jgi:hypothetical protein
MQRRDCFATTAALAFACCAALAGGAACGGAAAGPTPVPSLASTPAAGAFFNSLREAWRKPDRVPPVVLRAEIETFLHSWPGDGLAPLAHVYLALVALQLGDFATADAELARGLFLPPGNTRDLWTVACARRARLKGQAEDALSILRPLVGKNVDPVTRSVFEQELTLAALATHRDYEAISYMDAWLRAAAEEDAEQTNRTVAGLVEQVPKDVLVGSLQAMRAQRATFGYGIEIERILSRRLVQIATTSGDAELAQLLLDPDGGALVVGGDAGAILGELATSRRGMNVVEGRTLGLLLPTAQPALRDESADVLRGVMWSMGLPKGVRGAGAATAAGADAGASPVKAPCGALEAAPELQEPDPDEGVRLVTRDDAGMIDRTEGALDELAGEGASVIVAGLDPVTSARALAWGQARGVAVIALVPPAEPLTATDFAFVLGEARSHVIEALARAVPGLTAGSVAPIIDTSELDRFPAQGGPMGPLTLLPPVSCEIPAVRAGDPRFPLGSWDRDRIHAWLVTGSPTCARDLLGELSAAHARGTVGLTLEAAGMPQHAPSLKVVSAAAGIVPSAAAGDVRDDELVRFKDRLGLVGWWTALGRDAATLARQAIRALPPGTVSEVKSVAQLRVHARDELARARARLWTSETSGWAPGQHPYVVTRTVCTVEVPGATPTR